MLHLFDFNQWGEPMVEELNIPDLDPEEIGLCDMEHEEIDNIIIQLEAAYEEIMQSIEDVNRYLLRTTDDWFYYYQINCTVHNLKGIGYRQFKQVFNQ